MPLLTLLAHSLSLAVPEPHHLFRTEARKPWSSPWIAEGMGWMSGQAPEFFNAVSFPVAFPVREYR